MMDPGVPAATPRRAASARIGVIPAHHARARMHARRHTQAVRVAVAADGELATLNLSELSVPCHFSQRAISALPF